MKKNQVRLLSVAFLVALALGVASQVQAQTLVKCDVPFEFTSGGQTYASGVYTFSMGSSTGSRVVLLRNWDGSEARFLQAGVEDQDKTVGTVVRFRRIGTHYLLSSLAVEGADINVNFTPTRAEREMLVRADTKDVVTVLAMR